MREIEAFDCPRLCASSACDMPFEASSVATRLPDFTIDESDCFMVTH
nr:MAG TPA: hypothetical protein [Caudoviricetes sp.]